MKIIIIGGVAGGMSAATRLRRLLEDAEITIFEKGPFVSFAKIVISASSMRRLRRVAADIPPATPPTMTIFIDFLLYASR